MAKALAIDLLVAAKLLTEIAAVMMGKLNEQVGETHRIDFGSYPSQSARPARQVMHLPAVLRILGRIVAGQTALYPRFNDAPPSCRHILLHECDHILVQNGVSK